MSSPLLGVRRDQQVTVAPATLTGRFARRRALPWLGAVLCGVLALPPLRVLLEAAMVTHMLVQIPLLAIAGVLLAPGGVKRTQTAMHRAGAGAPMLIVATTTSIYWMLPRALDSALASGTAEWAKFVTLPLLLGVPLALGWRAASSLTRAFVVANALPMFAAVGWLYRDAPVRVCNYYLVGQQQLAGSALIWVAVAAGAAFGVGAFRRVPERSPAAPHTSVPGIVPRAGQPARDVH